MGAFAPARRLGRRPRRAGTGSRRALAAAIEHLPPYPTLLVFLIPVVLLFPLKLLGLWMLAHGSWLGAMAVLALAKVISMGVTAFIFDADAAEAAAASAGSAGSTSTCWCGSRRRTR